MLCTCPFKFRICAQYFYLLAIIQDNRSNSNFTFTSWGWIPISERFLSDETESIRPILIILPNNTHIYVYLHVVCCGVATGVGVATPTDAYWRAIGKPRPPFLSHTLVKLINYSLRSTIMRSGACNSPNLSFYPTYNGILSVHKCMRVHVWSKIILNLSNNNNKNVYRFARLYRFDCSLWFMHTLTVAGIVVTNFTSLALNSLLLCSLITKRNYTLI